jgi:hypothetical protein
MPKLACRCGYVHNLSPIPDEGWITVRDKDMESMLEAEVKSRQDPEQDQVATFWGRLYECPNCNRIMWEKPGDESFTVYRRE